MACGGESLLVKDPFANLPRSIPQTHKRGFRLPGLKQKFLDAARGLRAFLAPGSSGARGTMADVRSDDPDTLHANEGRDQAEMLRQAEQQVEKLRERMKKQARELKELRTKVAESVHGNEYHGINPENVIWILGFARTGSTWLARMMEELDDNVVWREPYVGALFGNLYYNWVGEKHFDTKHFILGRRFRESWLRSIRAFILSEANARFTGLARDGYLIIKEPNGSVGAPLLMEALPESRMVFLIRDPRDVVASQLDAVRKDSWLYQRRVEEGGRRIAMFDMQENTLVEKSASAYLRSVGNVREAYEAHKGPKVLVRYEELRVNTLDTLRRVYSTLGISTDDGALERTVREYAWEAIPEEQKGEGKFHRKASPGGWREDLTPEQAAAVERITSPLLEEFYAETGSGGIS
jgi:hypothetical protein